MMFYPSVDLIAHQLFFCLQVSNELLEEAFSQFGQVERAVVVVDDKGRSLGRGIVEFARKSSATKALTQIRVGLFQISR